MDKNTRYRLVGLNEIVINSKGEIKVFGKSDRAFSGFTSPFSRTLAPSSAKGNRFFGRQAGRAEVQSPPAILLPNPIGHIQKGIKSLKINPLSRVTVFFPLPSGCC
jgi:hypothetical protein